MGFPELLPATIFLACPMLLMVQRFHGADAANVFVSPSGRDTKACGKLEQPCQSLTHAVEKQARTGDVVKISGHFRKLELTRPIVSADTQFSSINITSYNGSLTITDKSNAGYLFQFERPLKSNSTYIVNIANLTFHNIHIINMRSYANDVLAMSWLISDCRFTFNSSAQKPSYIAIGKGIRRFNLKMERCFVHGGNVAKWFEVRVSVKNTSLISIEISNSTFYNMASVIRATELDINKPVFSTKILFLVRKCIFYSDKSIKFKETLFAIEGPLYTLKLPLRVFVQLLDSKFLNRSVQTSSNRAAVVFSRGFVSFQAVGCVFSNNAGSSGGALNLNTRKSRLLERCLFEGNAAIVDSICGNSMLMGNGGAVLISGEFRQSQTVIQSSVFRNNVASCYGDSVYAVKDYSIKLLDSSIVLDLGKGSSAVKLSQRALWYTESHRFSAVASNVTVARASSELQLSFFASTVQLDAFRQVNLQCPSGYNAKVVRMKSGENNQRNAYCLRCPDKTYTVGASYANISSLAEGKRRIKFHIRNCQKCPFGATCNRQLRAKPNFWGYEHGSAVQMVSCPPGYCCRAQSECKTFDSCNSRRRGVLCGQCAEGFSLSLLSNKCLPKGSCSVVASWAAVVACSLLALAVLAFMQEMIAFILRVFVGRKSPLVSWKSRKLHRSIMGRSLLGTAGSLLEDDSNNGESAKDFWIDQACSHEAEDKNTRIPMHVQSGMKSQHKNMNSTSGGMIKIVFFYYQMSALTMLYKTSPNISVFKFFFNFDLSFSGINKISCLLPEIGIVRKTILRSALPVTMLCCALIFYLALKSIALISQRPHTRRLVSSMKTRLLAAILQVLLLGYANLTSNTLLLLTCVSLANGKKVLYIGGQFECYQPWQYVLLSLFIVWSVPLVFSLRIAIKRIGRGTLCVNGFYAALLFPLPYVLYTCAKRCINTIKQCQESEGKKDEEEKEEEEKEEEEKEEEEKEEVRYIPFSDHHPATSEPDMKISDSSKITFMILKILGGPYRINKSARLVWEPVLILQKLILLSLHAFIQDPVAKSLSLLVAIFVLSYLNIWMQPFHSGCLNALNSLFMFFLFVSGVLNTLYAYTYTSGVEEEGPFSKILSAVGTIEACMQLLFPCVALLAVFITLATRCLSVLIYLVQTAWLKMRFFAN